MRSSTRSAVDPFIVMDVMEQAAQAEAAGRHIIHMEVGQPGTGAPKGATEALARAMAERLPEAEHLEIAGAGHCAHLEQPAASVEAVSSFLDSLPLG